MKLPVNDWLDVVQVRKSRRRFLAKEIEQNLIERIKEVCSEFRPFPGVRSVLVADSAGEIFKGAVGSYGKIKGASTYLAFIGDLNYENIEEKVGYVGEGLVLEATSLGLSTCWVGGFFKPDVVARHINLKEGERVFAVTPIGYTEEDTGLEEKIMSFLARAHKRKPLEEIAQDYGSGKWPEWAKEGLKAARLAPSAVNRQPWRFRFDNNGVIISLDNTKDTYDIPKRLDCGIAMLHFELAALKQGRKGEWEFLASPEVAKYK